MQKLKYYTVVLTAIFLSYPNITLSQTPSTQNEGYSYNNYERARAVCEEDAGGIYERKEGTDDYVCTGELEYDAASFREECEKYGGIKDECEIDLPIRITGLEEKCRAAQGEWINSFCSFDEVLKDYCKFDGGEWTGELKNRRCVISDNALFTHERREEILADVNKKSDRRYKIKGLHKVIFYAEFNFKFLRPSEDEKIDYSTQKGRYNIETKIEDTYSVQVGVPGICLHPSAQKRVPWPVSKDKGLPISEGPCVDPEGANIGEDSIWIIFSKDDEHGFIDNHGFKFTKRDDDYYYLDLEDADGHIWLNWSTSSGDKGRYQIIEYTTIDPDSGQTLTKRLIDPDSGLLTAIEPGEVPVIRLRYDVDSLAPWKDVQLSDKRERDLIGVAP